MKLTVPILPPSCPLLPAHSNLCACDFVLSGAFRLFHRSSLAGQTMQVVAPTSESVSIRAGVRVILDTPRLEISHGSLVSGVGTTDPQARVRADRGSGGGGGNGLSSNGSALVGRADRLVLFEAGTSSDG